MAAFEWNIWCCFYAFHVVTACCLTAAPYNLWCVQAGDGKQQTEQFYWAVCWYFIWSFPMGTNAAGVLLADLKALIIEEMCISLWFKMCRSKLLLCNPWKLFHKWRRYGWDPCLFWGCPWIAAGCTKAWIWWAKHPSGSLVICCFSFVVLYCVARTVSIWPWYFGVSFQTLSKSKAKQTSRTCPEMTNCLQKMASKWWSFFMLLLVLGFSNHLRSVWRPEVSRREDQFFSGTSATHLIQFNFKIQDALDTLPLSEGSASPWSW